MPKQTFFNLPDEKREQIIQVAIDEFAENDYESASISRIVAKAGIAKGSFYQYFTDKEDLYAYLLQLLVEAKIKFLSLNHPDPRHIGIFAYLRWAAEVGMAFQLAHPQLTRMGLRAMNSGGLPKALDTQIRGSTLAFYRQLVEVGRQQGDIAPEVDPELAAVIFDAILSNVGRYILERVTEAGIDLDRDNRAVIDLPEVKELFAQTVGVLEQGFGRRSAKPGGE